MGYVRLLWGSLGGGCDNNDRRNSRNGNYSQDTIIMAIAVMIRRFLPKDFRDTLV